MVLNILSNLKTISHVRVYVGYNYTILSEDFSIHEHPGSNHKDTQEKLWFLT